MGDMIMCACVWCYDHVYFVRWHDHVCLLLLYDHVCLCVVMYAQGHSSVETRSQNQISSTITIYLILLPPVPCRAGIRDTRHLPLQLAFYRSAGDLNSGPMLAQVFYPLSQSAQTFQVNFKD